MRHGINFTHSKVFKNPNPNNFVMSQKAPIKYQSGMKIMDKNGFNKGLLNLLKYLFLQPLYALV